MKARPQAADEPPERPWSTATSRPTCCGRSTDASSTAAPAARRPAAQRGTACVRRDGRRAGHAADLSASPYRARNTFAAFRRRVRAESRCGHASAQRRVATALNGVAVRLRPPAHRRRRRCRPAWRLAAGRRHRRGHDGRRRGGHRRARQDRCRHDHQGVVVGAGATLVTGGIGGCTPSSTPTSPPPPSRPARRCRSHPNPRRPGRRCGAFPQPKAAEVKDCRRPEANRR